MCSVVVLVPVGSKCVVCMNRYVEMRRKDEKNKRTKQRTEKRKQRNNKIGSEKRRKKKRKIVNSWTSRKRDKNEAEQPRGWTGTE